MKLNIIKRIAALLLLTFLFIGFPLTGLGQGNIGDLYLGFSFLNNKIRGDFESANYLLGDDKLFIIPKINNNLGYKLYFGGKVEENIDLEVSYINSSHYADWFGLGFLTQYKCYGTDLKINVFDNGQNLSFYGLVGIAAYQLGIENGTIDLNKLTLEDAIFWGMGLNFGGGIIYYINPQLALNGEVIYRYVSYSFAGTKNNLKPIKGTLDGTGLSWNIGVTYFFN